MALSEAVRVRLRQDKRLEYEDEAARRNMTLPEYLRERLERDDVALSGLHQVRDELEEIRGLVTQGGNSSGGIDPGQALEMLLLLRSIAGQERVNMAQAEVKRQGLNVWRLNK